MPFCLRGPACARDSSLLLAGDSLVGPAVDGSPACTLGSAAGRSCRSSFACSSCFVHAAASAATWSPGLAPSTPGSYHRPWCRGCESSTDVTLSHTDRRGSGSPDQVATPHGRGVRPGMAHLRAVNYLQARGLLRFVGRSALPERCPALSLPLLLLLLPDAGLSRRLLLSLYHHSRHQYTGSRLPEMGKPSKLLQESPGTQAEPLHCFRA